MRDGYRYDYAKVMRVFKWERPIRYRFYCVHSAINVVKSREFPHDTPFLFSFLLPPTFPSFSLSVIQQYGCCDRISNCAFKFPLHMLRKMSTARKPVQRITIRIFHTRVLSATDRSIAARFSPSIPPFFFSDLFWIRIRNFTDLQSADRLK